MVDTIKVLTARSVDRLLREGGSSSWKLDQRRARRMKYVVCYRNPRRAAEFADEAANEDTHDAFLIGKISDVVTCPRDRKRWLICFSEYALLKDVDKWAGDRNPVIYADLGNLKINPDDLDWHAMPEPETSQRSVGGLTISEAKQLLANSHGVPEDAIEIIIRG